MIPERYLQQWSNHVFWQSMGMIEQDLLIRKVLIDLYEHSYIRDHLLFRGGTALNMLYLDPPARYSEDIDLVQLDPSPIGDTIDIIRKILGEYLGEPKRKLTNRSAKLIYRYDSVEGFPAKLKIEINTTEHFHVNPIRSFPFQLNSDWKSGSTNIMSYDLAELMGTKFRALYQRRKGRDLFDIWYVFHQNKMDVQEVLKIFHAYCAYQNLDISKSDFLSNLEIKRKHQDFRVDMHPLLPHYISWDFDKAYGFVVDLINESL